MVSSMKDFDGATKYALVITVSNYQGLREQGYTGFSDIEEVKDDHKTHDDNLKYLSFEKENVIDLVNPTREQVNESVIKLRDIFLENASAGNESLLYAYYGGAGASIGAPGQIVVLNGTDKNVGYPLEERLISICSMNDLTAGLMIFDCSRVPLSPGLTIGANIETENEEW